MTPVNLFVANQLDVTALLHLQIQTPKSQMMDILIRTTEVSLPIFFRVQASLIASCWILANYAFSI